MEFMKIMVETDWIQKDYYVSDTTGHTLEGYGVVRSPFIKLHQMIEISITKILLSRIPFTDLSIYKLPSMMGRKAVVASYLINGDTTQVATVHLESLDTAKTRKIQLKIIAKILHDSQNAALLGGTVSPPPPKQI